MSHVDPGPLATYESLADPHLSGYFNNTRMRKHLKRMGLITRRGEIVSEKVFRLNNARKEHQRHIRDVLAQAIVHKALDMERHRQTHIKRQLEEIAKIERVRRVRAERALRGDEDILPLLSPRTKQQKKKSGKSKKVPILQTVADSEEYEQRPPQSVGYPAMPAGPPYNTRADRIKMQYPNVEVDNQHLYELDRDALRSFTLNLSQFDLGSGVSPYCVPSRDEKIPAPKRKPKRRPATSSGVPARRKIRPASNARSLKLHRREPPMMHRAQVHTLTRVTFKYLGKMVHLDHEEEDPRDEVVVMQQHCGGENVRIFKGMVMKGDNFVVISRRHRTFPFSLTFYLNGVQVERLSTCCEYKHNTGHKLGAKSSHFGIIKIEGYQPCFKCLISQGTLKTRPDPTPPSTGGRTMPSKPTRYKKKLKGADGKDEEYAAEDFQESSKSSVTTDDVQTDGPRAPSEISSSDISAESSPLTSENEDSDTDTDSDTESHLPSLKPDDSDSSDTDSTGSQKKSKASMDRGRVKSPKPRVPSAGKKRVTPHSKISSKPDRTANLTQDRSKPLAPVKTEPRSPPPPIQKVERSSSSSSSAPSVKDFEKKKSSSSSASSVSDAAEQPRDEVKVSSSSDDEQNKKALLLEAKQLADDENPALIKRPESPEPESTSSSSEESNNDSSKETPISILPRIRGKSHIDLKNSRFTSGQIEELITYFNKDRDALQIQELILSNCGIDDASLKLMLNAFLRSSSLKTLDISGNKVSSVCIDEILEVCHKNPVEHLYVGGNPLSDSGCKELIDGLMRSQESIFTAKLQKKVSQTLIASVLKDTRKELSGDMASSVSSASSMTSLASSAVSDSVMLLSLDISHTNAGHESFASLGHFLSFNPKLSHLNLSGNSINVKALEQITKPLTNGANKNLKSLLLDKTGIDDEMAELILDSLLTKSRLTLLSIKGNRMTVVGKTKLQEHRETSSLENLFID